MYRIEHTWDTHDGMWIALGCCAIAWKDNNNREERKKERGEFDFLSQAQVRRCRDVTEVLRQMPGALTWGNFRSPGEENQGWKSTEYSVDWIILASWRIRIIKDDSSLVDRSPISAYSAPICIPHF